MAKEYRFTTKSYTDELVPEAVLDVSDPVYQLIHPEVSQETPQTYSNIDQDVTVTENSW
jgi:hypothetical protein